MTSPMTKAAMSPPTATSFSRATINLQSQDDTSIQTIPELIEYNAAHNPHHPFCIQAQKQSQNAPPQLLSVSHLQLKRAIAQCQTWLANKVVELKLPSRGEDGKVCKGPPVALYVESDVGLLIHLFSLMSLGVPVLLLSARLSPTAVHHLLVKTAACAVIVSSRLKNTATEAFSLFSATEPQPAMYAQAAFASFLDPQTNSEDADGSICKPGYYVEENDRNVLILHSSGTTGLPKPIYQSHNWLLCFTTCHEFSGDEETLSLSLSTLPLYHGYGLVTPALSLGIGKTLCIPPPSVIPTGAFIIDLLKSSKAQSLISVPSILEEISTLPQGQGIQALASLQFVAFGGGLLKPRVGDKLVAGDVKVLNHYGSTESGPIAPFFVPTPDYDWHYFRLRKDMNMRLERGPLLEDGVQSYTLITHPFGWATTFIFQDQLIANPQNPASDYSAIGRNDDLIVLANGEKVTPRILETMLSESDLVNAAVAFGDGQFELGVIVQPSQSVTVEDYDRYKSSIWPIILQAGERMDAHARISSKDAIIIVPSGTSLPRSDKGSVMRKEVYKMFDAEIEEVYQTLDNNVVNNGGVDLDMDNLEEDLKTLIQTRLTWRSKAEQWTINDDLFELGMDSLQALQLRRFILSSLPIQPTSAQKAERVPRDIVYQHPTVSQLAKALKDPAELSSNESSIDHLVEQFSIKGDEAGVRPEAGAVILMTGGTGSLGSCLLAHLASVPSVARVICLNRPHRIADAYVRQAEAFKSRCITVDAGAWSKIEIFQTNTALPLLGLKEIEYARIQEQVTHVLHNAWPMDFKRKLPSFKAQFQVLQNLFDLALDAHSGRPMMRPKLLFVSSIAVVGQYPLVKSETMVPEVFMRDESCSNDIGYAKAKLVCERVLEKAAQDHAAKVEVVYVRVGQMSGSKETGSWNTDEHIAALFKSAQSVGSLPHLEGTLSWIPVDSAAETLSELLLSKHSTKVAYHLENPIRQSWQDALRIVAPELGLPSTGFTPFTEWLDKVCAFPDEKSDKVPARKLEDFFRADFEHMACGNIVLDTKNTRDVSSTLRNLSHIRGELLVSYIRHWRSIGYLA